MASIVKRKNRYSVVYTYKDDDGNQHQKYKPCCAMWLLCRKNLDNIFFL